MRNLTEEKLRKVVKILGYIFLGLIMLYLIGYLLFGSMFKMYNQEKRVINAAKLYFESNPKKLPTKEDDFIELKLSQLFESGLVDNIVVPSTNRTCSVDSWVRVIKTKNDYEYYVYLDCGMWKSFTDHVGPKIILEGDSPLYISLDSKYSDPGVKSVIDNKDKNISKDKVYIDSSLVDTSKTGEYKVKYSVYDSVKNRTDIERVVYVTKNLTDEVINSTNDSNKYSGNNVNNYVLFSGQLFRIIGINSDNTVKLVTDDNVSLLAYGNESNFNDSNVASWLNEVYYPSLKHSDKYIKKDSVWCLDDISVNRPSCDNYSKEYAVGMLTKNEYSSIVNSSNYLNAESSFLLLNKDSSNNAYTTYPGNKDKTLIANENRITGVKPVINVFGNNLFIESGNGSFEKPYKLNDYIYGTENQHLNTRLVGEYISYSNHLFRIVKVEESGNIKLNMSTVLNVMSSGINNTIRSGYKDDAVIKKFNPSIAGNIGQFLNNEGIKYLYDNLIVNANYEVPTFDGEKKYKEFDKEVINTKLSIVKSYDLFSAPSNALSVYEDNYWLLDSLNFDNRTMYVNSNNSIIFTGDNDNLLENAFKLSLTLNNNVKIASGNGTVSNPYTVR